MHREMFFWMSKTPYLGCAIAFRSFVSVSIFRGSCNLTNGGCLVGEGNERREEETMGKDTDSCERFSVNPLRKRNRFEP